ncbi:MULTISPECIES: hypothetical protein [Paenibacillus]|uniref:Uncharacterized protein n=1 Tax=Paenibacillus albilobatus TaxID=2716884 RepID=A0A920CCK9_9BACL|nr:MULTISPECIES: hypothetical protein [Paenibacillus]GIO31722.1 hypothetical protein J2TS6_28630 [Paenibacillus albilobatus]
MKHKFTSIRKKTRGMSRRARKLPDWGAYHQELDVEGLCKHQKEYVKLWISPFYNLHQISENEVGKKNPPYKFRKQVLEQLIVIYLEWEQKLIELKKPYYLKIWVGDPEFMDSQVVAAVRSEIEYYDQLFMPSPEPKQFPYQIKHPSFGLFTWERCVNGYHVWESDLETEEEIEQARKKAVETKEYMIGGKVERSYFIGTGDMWVGSIRRS